MTLMEEEIYGRGGGMVLMMGMEFFEVPQNENCQIGKGLRQNILSNGH